MRAFCRSVVAVLLLSTAANAQVPDIVCNDNRVAAGRLSNGVLTVQLTVSRGIWHPDRDQDPGIDIVAVGEEGKPLSVPAPLLRVQQGTEIRATVRNALTDSSVLVLGLGDSVRIAAGASRLITFKATSPGTFVYRVHYSAQTSRFGEDRVATGAFVVDAPGADTSDRVLVLQQMLDSVRLKPYPGAVEELLSINGRSWPHTERLEYDLGQTIRWRVVNGSYDVHPMHLHGAYFRVLSRGATGTDTIYTPEQQRVVVTERLLPLTTMMMEWKPERAGNWLFHCHLNFHIMAHPPLGDMKAAGPMHEHDQHGMGGLVMGTHIRGPVAADATGRRQLRLVAQQGDSIPGEYSPIFAYSFDDAPTTRQPGPTIVVNRNEPIAITVVNRLGSPTSVHWHGLEIESYFDGVGGFGGTPQRITPVIAKGDSFVVKMTPPRAGTFIYHTHFEEARQQGGGLYGAFVVLPEGEHWNDATERLFVLGTPRSDTPLIVNGDSASHMEMKAGNTYRLRMINITLDRPNMFVRIVDGESQLKWRPIAEDGADLPPHRAIETDKPLLLTIGKTIDALFTPEKPGTLQFQVRRPNGEILSRVYVTVR